MATPLRSFLGGLGLAFPVYFYLRLNGAVLGISGFIHRAARGDMEAGAAVTALILGGFVLPEDDSPRNVVTSLPRLFISGLLTGCGTKMAGGCTSGHMICGISRFSLRSTVATAIFFTAASITAQILYSAQISPIGSSDYSLGPNGLALLAWQLLPLAVSILLYCMAPKIHDPSDGQESLPNEMSPLNPPANAELHRLSLTQSTLRVLAAFATSLEFALALRLSNLTDPERVIRFLLLPVRPSFDASLLFLALGALPLSMGLYHRARGKEEPHLGGGWTVPKSWPVDTKLVLGSVLFGIGWGIAGICPGPGLVNLGRALASGENIVPFAAWVASVAIGGFVTN